MGLFDFFKGQRKDEDALASMREADGASLAGESDVLAAGGLAELDVADDVPNLQVAIEAIRSQPMLRMFGLDDRLVEAVEKGWVNVEQMPTQTIDLRGSGAREQVLAALGEHGIDPQQAGSQINLSDNPQLQQQLLAVLEGFGLSEEMRKAYGVEAGEPKP